jgi:hypothetical protein
MCIICWEISGVCAPLSSCPQPQHNEAVQLMNTLEKDLREANEQLNHRYKSGVEDRNTIKNLQHKLEMEVAENSRLLAENEQLKAQLQQQKCICRKGVYDSSKPFICIYCGKYCKNKKPDCEECNDTGKVENLLHKRLPGFGDCYYTERLVEDCPKCKG